MVSLGRRSIYTSGVSIAEVTAPSKSDQPGTGTRTFRAILTIYVWRRHRSDANRISRSTQGDDDDYDNNNISARVSLVTPNETAATCAWVQWTHSSSSARPVCVARITLSPARSEYIYFLFSFSFYFFHLLLLSYTDIESMDDIILLSEYKT